MTSNPVQRFKDKICVLSASTTGIGFALAKRICQEGGKVVISSRSQQHIDAALAELHKDHYEAAGIISFAERDYQKLVDFAVQTYGGIDCLYCNAAVSKHIGPTITTPESIITRTFHTNVTAVFLLIQAALPHLEKSSSPSILMMSTIGGLNAEPMIGFYCVTKSALLMLMKVLSLELATRKIRVNCVAPGVITTHFSEKFPEQWKVSALKRAGTAAECAAACAFLLSEDASYITGETLVVAGGWPTRL